MNELTDTLLYFVFPIFILGAVLVVSLRRVKAMKAAAHKTGISGIRANLLGPVIGSWRGYAVTWKMFGGGKNGPPRAVVEIGVSAPARLTIYKRIKFDLNFSLLGPPVVQTAFDSDFIVRSDDTTFAGRLLGDTTIVEEIRTCILGRTDRLEIDGRRVRSIRVAWQPMTRDQACDAAWKLASTVVERLGLPPASST